MGSREGWGQRAVLAALTLRDLELDWEGGSTVPSSSPGASSDVLLGFLLGAELEPGKDTHTHPPPLGSSSFSVFSEPALWCSCSLTSDLIKTLSLAQPLRAQSVAAYSQTAALKGTPEHSAHLLFAPERGSDNSKITQPVMDRARTGSQGCVG